MSKFYTARLLFLSILSAFSFAAPSWGGDFIRTVWDIDGTIAIHLDEVEFELRELYLSRPENLVTIFLKNTLHTYYIFPGVRESMASLSKRGIGIHFFSAAPEERNQILLSAIMVEGKSLKQLAASILSRQHQSLSTAKEAADNGMLKISDDESDLLVGSPPKKDLRTVDPDFSNTVLFDDSRYGILDSQRDNWIPIEFREEDRVSIAMGFFEEALELSQLKGITLSKAIAEIKAEIETLKIREMLHRFRMRSPIASCASLARG